MADQHQEDAPFGDMSRDMQDVRFYTGEYAGNEFEATKMICRGSPFGAKPKAWKKILESQLSASP